jgi:hypothetical protein
MASNIYITPSTSLVLIKQTTTPTTIFLSTFRVPDFQVNVRDITGSSTLQVTLSTIGGAKFLNNTTSYPLNQPYGFVNMSLRTSTIWQILHTSGQTPTESAANVGTTSLSSLFVGVLSTGTKRVSSMTLENLTTPNSIQLVGPFIIGNLSTPGFIQLQSTLNVFGNASFDKNIFVSGAVSTLSSFSVETLLPLSSGVLTYSSLGVGGNINVTGSVFLGSTLHTQSTLQIDSLQVVKQSPDTTLLILDSVQIGDEGSVGGSGDVSMGRDLSVGGQLLVGRSIGITQEVSSFAGTFSTGTLTVGGPLFLMNSLSSLSTASFVSSLTLQSSLFLQTSLSSFSTANIGKIVSTASFVTNLLSSSTSFSTAGDFTVLSTLTVKGTLSTNSLVTQQLFSTGLNLTVGQTVSTTDQTTLENLTVEGSAFMARLVLTTAGIGGNVFTGDINNIFQLTATDILLHGNMTIEETVATYQALFQSTLGFNTNMTVYGDMTVLGQTDIPIYDVGSYALSSLQITTSSPFVALRASSFVGGALTAEQVQIAYDPLSGSTNPQAFTEVQTNQIDAKEVNFYRFSTQTVYTENLVTTPSRIFSDSLPRMEVDQKALFGLGLSTLRLESETIQANTFFGSFIGDASIVTSVPLFFSTVSATTVLASTITTTNLFSTSAAALYGAVISNAGQVATALDLPTPFYFISSGYTIPPIVSGSYFNTGPFMKIESLSQSTLNVADTLYIESSTQKVGVGISSPIYDFDIRGSLYYSGTLSYSTLVIPFTFSTTKPIVSFSSIWYSSILVNDDAVIPAATGNSNVYVSPLGTATRSYVFLPGSKDSPFTLSERVFPETSLCNITYNYNGIYTNANTSTIDLDLKLFVYNDTKQVGVNTTQLVNDNPVLITPLPIPPAYDLYVNGSFVITSPFDVATYGVQTPLLVSTLAGVNILTSSLTTPTFGLNPINPSTLNTFSTSFAQYNYHSKITVNSFVDLIKDGTTLQGYTQLKRPYKDTFDKSYYFSVYNEAYISSVTIPQLHADVLFVQSEVL